MCVLATCLDAYVYTYVSILFLCLDKISSTCESCKSAQEKGEFRQCSILHHPAQECLLCLQDFRVMGVSSLSTLIKLTWNTLNKLTISLCRLTKKSIFLPCFSLSEYFPSVPHRETRQNCFPLHCCSRDKTACCDLTAKTQRSHSILHSLKEKQVQKQRQGKSVASFFQEVLWTW